MQFSHFAYVPNELAEKVIAAHKAAYGEQLIEEKAKVCFLCSFLYRLGYFLSGSEGTTLQRHRGGIASAHNPDY